MQSKDRKIINSVEVTEDLTWCDGVRTQDCPFVSRQDVCKVRGERHKKKTQENNCLPESKESRKHSNHNKPPNGIVRSDAQKINKGGGGNRWRRNKNQNTLYNKTLFIVMQGVA